MTFVQRLFCAVLPRAWAQSMERESRAWLARCRECGTARSIWELGGIRWKAAGNPLRRLSCEACGQVTWHRLEHQQAQSPSGAS